MSPEKRVNVIEINSTEGFHETLREYMDGDWIFRGQSKSDWPLIPKAGRDPYKDKGKDLIEYWQRSAYAYLETTPQNPWEWLAVAQHHGLATRLLDWTSRPLIAAFFAVDNHENYNCDAAVWAAKFTDDVEIVRAHSDVDPAGYTEVAKYFPNRVDQRIAAQSGLFTIHPDPIVEMTKDTIGVQELHKIIIKRSIREKLKSELSYYGVYGASLFPDLDGLSNYINWKISQQSGQKTKHNSPLPRTPLVAHEETLADCLGLMKIFPVKLIAKDLWPNEKDWKKRIWEYTQKDGKVVDSKLLVNVNDTFQFSVATDKTKQDCHVHQNVLEIYVSSSPMTAHFLVGKLPDKVTCKDGGAIIVLPGIVHEMKLTGFTYVFQATVDGSGVKDDKQIMPKFAKKMGP